jgi:hypothetical protein
MLDEQVIVGEVEAGEAAKVRKQLNQLIKNLNASTFDLMDVLFTIKSKGFFGPKFNTFSEFVKDLDGLKLSKAYYLTRIRETMNAAEIPREVYEPIGLSKLRAIARLDPKENYVVDGISTSGVEVIKKLIELKDVPLEDLKTLINEVQGLTGEDSMVWLNISLKHSAREVVKKAISVAKKNIGSVSKNDEGVSQDASDGSALEVVALDFLSDPANNYDQDALDKDDKASV